MTTTPTQNKTLKIGHSPDPDDAFMWYPLANFTAPNGEKLTPKIDTRGYEFVHVLEDIQSLNERSEKGELEITAFSVHEYPFVADQYAMTSCGSSMGDHYGPMIVAPAPPGNSHSASGKSIQSIQDLKGAKLAIPGERTTAWLAFQLLLAEHGMTKDDVDWHVVMFDEILDKVQPKTSEGAAGDSGGGEYDAGLIIHEGQITYQNNGLEKVVDLGAWWSASRDLPLPLGANAIRRDLVESGEAGTICRVLLDSIEYALAHREEAVNFALNYARDMGTDLADKFVGMYVNAWTLDYGEKGRQAVAQLLNEAIAAELVPDCGEIDFIDPA